MKTLAFSFATLLAGLFTATASGEATEKSSFHTFGAGNSFIFVENGITFCVFPDGEFDFYMENTAYGPVTAVSPAAMSFNGGYDYNSCLQYDDYGAVIQVVNTPVFYDAYGRVARIGAIDLCYTGRNLVQIGGLRLFYNPYGVYSHCNGFINNYNVTYYYRPYYTYFARPVTSFCMVSYQPYRVYYAPVRYTYYQPYYNNVRSCYVPVGTSCEYKEKPYKKSLYCNDRRVVASAEPYVYKRETAPRSYASSKKYEASRPYAATRNPAQRTYEPVLQREYASPQSQKAAPEEGRQATRRLSVEKTERAKTYSGERTATHGARSASYRHRG